MRPVLIGQIKKTPSVMCILIKIICVRTKFVATFF